METKKIVRIIMIILGGILFFYLGTIIANSFASTYRFLTKSNDINGVRGQYEIGSDTITIFVKNDSLMYRSTMAHELCHRNENYHNRIHYDPLGNLLNEIECNILSFP